MVNLHKAVKKLCIDRDLTITELAERMGVNRKTLYSAISNGNPRLSTIEGIAKALNVTVSGLIREGE
tara:strand:- start:10802 stop:11002 length:201 start_codon:yes stop_codon:yes gene_type:complete